MTRVSSSIVSVSFALGNFPYLLTYVVSLVSSLKVNFKMKQNHLVPRRRRNIILLCNFFKEVFNAAATDSFRLKKETRKKREIAKRGKNGLL